MKIKLLLTACIFHSLYCKVSAQAYYMHEAAEDSDGNPIGGIIGLLLLIGLGVLIDKLREKSKTENCDNSYYGEYDDYAQTNVDDDDVFDKYLDDVRFDEDIKISNFNIPLKSVSNTPVKKKENDSFKEKVIGMYGNQTERFGGLLIIKEDGEYHYLSGYSDERYKILDEYLLEHKPHNCTDTTIKVDWDLIRNYKMFHKKELPPFNPIENANIEANDFLGGKLLALKSYYEKKPCYRLHPVSKLEFFLSIGFDEIILLHKIIKQPMDAEEWFDFKVMQLKGFKTFEEYEEYRKTAGHFHEEEDGWYDDFYGYLAPTYDKADEVYQEKQGYTYMNAYEEINKIKWEL
ncbi:hypothetical protein [Alistipes putredinis]|uniref:hypothetical protein n=1 Tax=Alistipes putredinis TaxID=28117 RepID=UPI00242A9CBB|nr:hypothetical protein [Alistipes putredinis]MBS6651522.1 hypothetical protein [Alistipes putredinis]